MEWKCQGGHYTWKELGDNYKWMAPTCQGPDQERRVAFFQKKKKANVVELLLAKEGG